MTTRIQYTKTNDFLESEEFIVGSSTYKVFLYPQLGTGKIVNITTVTTIESFRGGSHFTLKRKAKAGLRSLGIMFSSERRSKSAPETAKPVKAVKPVEISQEAPAMEESDGFLW